MSAGGGRFVDGLLTIKNPRHEEKLRKLPVLKEPSKPVVLVPKVSNLNSSFAAASSNDNHVSFSIQSGALSLYSNYLRRTINSVEETCRQLNLPSPPVLVIPLTDVDAETLGHLHTYMTTGEMKLTFGDYKNVLRIARQLQINDIVEFTPDFDIESDEDSDCDDALISQKPTSEGKKNAAKDTATNLNQASSSNDSERFLPKRKKSTPKKVAKAPAKEKVVNRATKKSKNAAKKTPTSNRAKKTGPQASNLDSSASNHVLADNSSSSNPPSVEATTSKGGKKSNVSSLLAQGKKSLDNVDYSSSDSSSDEHEKTISQTASAVDDVHLSESSLSSDEDIDVFKKTLESFNSTKPKSPRKGTQIKKSQPKNQEKDEPVKKNPHVANPANNLEKDKEKMTANVQSKQKDPQAQKSNASDKTYTSERERIARTKKLAKPTPIKIKTAEGVVGLNLHEISRLTNLDKNTSNSNNSKPSGSATNGRIVPVLNQSFKQSYYANMNNGFNSSAGPSKRRLEDDRDMNFERSQYKRSCNSNAFSFTNVEGGRQTPAGVRLMSNAPSVQKIINNYQQPQTSNEGPHQRILQYDKKNQNNAPAASQSSAGSLVTHVGAIKEEYSENRPNNVGAFLGHNGTRPGLPPPGANFQGNHAINFQQTHRAQMEPNNHGGHYNMRRPAQNFYPPRPLNSPRRGPPPNVFNYNPNQFSTPSKSPRRNGGNQVGVDYAKRQEEYDRRHAPGYSIQNSNYFDRPRGGQQNRHTKFS